MKTSELQGAALDWAVAKAHGLEWALAKNNAGGLSYDAGLHGNLFADNIDLPGRYRRYNPSTDWAQGGPIIERENVGIVCQQPESTQRCAYRQTNDGEVFYYYGSTPLIAAMRCFVASKLGDDVEIPQELL